MIFGNISAVEWIQIASAIGTLGAAIAAWVSAKASNKSAKTAEKQLEEMREQRIVMYQPSIVFTKKIYKAHIKQKIEKPYFSMFNVGYGVAKDIIIRWNEPDYLNAIFEPLTSQEDVFWEITEPFNDNNKKIVNKKLDFEQHIQHLLPSSVENKPAEIEIPLILTINLIQDFHNELIINENSNAKSTYQLWFSVIYKDINNGEHKENHCLRATFLSYTNTESPEVTMSIEMQNKFLLT